MRMGVLRIQCTLLPAMMTVIMCLELCGIQDVWIEATKEAPICFTRSTSAAELSTDSPRFWFNALSASPLAWEIKAIVFASTWPYKSANTCCGQPWAASVVSTSRASSSLWTARQKVTLVFATNGPAEWQNGFNPPLFHSKHHFADAHVHYFLNHHLSPISWRAQGGWVIRLVDGFSGPRCVWATLPLSLPPKFAAPLVSYKLRSKFVWFQGPPLPTTSVLLHCDLVSCNHVRIDLPIVQWRFSFSSGSLTKILETVLVNMK